MRIFIGDMLKLNNSAKKVELEDVWDDNKYIPDVNRFTCPVRVIGELTNQQEIFNLKAELHLSFETCCHRCGQKIEYAMNLGLDEKIYPQGAGELDDFTYQGKEIDFTQMVIDNIILNIPMKILCSEDCQGF